MLPFRRGRAPDPAPPLPLTGKALYDLAGFCRAYATELANHDPRRIVLPQCHRFNQWLITLRRYDKLAPTLSTLRPARPITRWQVAVLTMLVWFMVYLFALTRGLQTLSLFVLNGSVLVFLTFYMLPERLFGTTIEEIEGKVLRIVLALEEMLAHGDVPLTEAAFFRAREDLEAARRELREQIDLAHRD